MKDHLKEVSACPIRQQPLPSVFQGASFQKVYGYEDLKNLGSAEANEKRLRNYNHSDKKFDAEEYKDPTREGLDEKIRREIPYMGDGSFDNKERDMKKIGGLYLRRTQVDAEKREALQSASGPFCRR
ncbi:MAG TPA: hypothetical protein DCL38_05390 [Lachnospiraceae bacterium]|nr:hypothetical protein [Lachnospiraceae bacterium]